MQGCGSDFALVEIPPEPCLRAYGVALQDKDLQLGKLADEALLPFFLELFLRLNVANTVAVEESLFEWLDSKLVFAIGFM